MQKPYKKDTTELDIKNYENNLKLKCENLRKCIDIQLANIFPEQDRAVRTYFWCNFAMLGLMVTLFFSFVEKPIELSMLSVFAIVFVFLFLLSILVSIYYCVKAIIVGAVIAYGSIEKKLMDKIKENEYAFSQGLVSTIEEQTKAFDMNCKTIARKAKALRRSLIFIYSAFVFLFVFILMFSIIALKNNLKGGIEVAEKPVERVVATTTHSDNNKVVVTTITTQETNSKDNLTVQITKSDDSKSKK